MSYKGALLWVPNPASAGKMENDHPHLHPALRKNMVKSSDPSKKRCRSSINQLRYSEVARDVSNNPEIHVGIWISSNVSTQAALMYCLVTGSHSTKRSQICQQLQYYRACRPPAECSEGGPLHLHRCCSFLPLDSSANRRVDSHKEVGPKNVNQWRITWSLLGGSKLVAYYSRNADVPVLWGGILLVWAKFTQLFSKCLSFPGCWSTMSSLSCIGWGAHPGLTMHTRVPLKQQCNIIVSHQAQNNVDDICLK